jgi:hypothetical protein
MATESEAASMPSSWLTIARTEATIAQTDVMIVI